MCLLWFVKLPQEMKQRIVKIGGFILLCNIGLYFAIQNYFTTSKHYVTYNDGNLKADDQGKVKQVINLLQINKAINQKSKQIVGISNITNQNSIGLSRITPAGTIQEASKWNATSTGTFDVAAVILVRIYKDDKPKWGTLELEQWVRYMQYAGVCRVYLYDNYKYKNESLKNWTASTFSEFEVTYHDWSKYMPYSISGTQLTAYQHALDKYKSLSTWQIAFDMDEYPFSSVDKEPGFLVRFVRRYGEKYPTVSELSMKNFLFLGKPSNETLVIERMLRRTPAPANSLDKPVYRTNCISRAQVHHNSLKCGKSKDVDPVDMRNNHYWGARLQKWGDDTPEILAKTIPDESAREIAQSLIKLQTLNGTLLSQQCRQLM